jgi:anti-sigma regulatory factor (Ser/Thr protein kinase)
MKFSVPEAIIKYIEQHGSTGSRDLSVHFGISRQALNIHLRALIDAGRLVKTGSTKNARYHISAKVEVKERFAADFQVAGLDESRIYQRLSLSLNLSRWLKADVESIANYAFTEMLNNVIDHSDSNRTRVRASLGAGKLSFEIKDWGKGVFASIAETYLLDNEQDAMVELVKGKTTTMPEAHSGEGIFFTSKAVDRFVLRSHRIQLEWDRTHGDVFVSTPRYTKGTSVKVEIRRNSRLKLEDVFTRYAPEEFDYQFQKTLVHVKLLNREYISRSEAKRLLQNLEKFRVVELDFRDVQAMGQGFADEIFRVFHSNYPNIEVHAVHTSPVIQAMIQHVRASK